MTKIRNIAIAAIASLTVAASMASPANALTSWQKAQIGLGAAALVAGAAAHAAHGRYHDDGYYDEGISYRRASRKCARRFGWHTWRFENCMDRYGY
ncbi:MAG: hypothetical protein WBD37_10425 [Anderseniella sp.]